jgi:ribosomal protein L11 methylase PrmA
LLALRNDIGDLMPVLWRIAARVEGAAAAATISEIFDELAGSVSAFETQQDGATPADWSVETYSPAALLNSALSVRLELAARAAGGAILELVEEHVAERDWLDENRRAFPPQRVGRFLIHG